MPIDRWTRGLAACCLLLALLTALPCRADGPDTTATSLLQNGSFESGLAGYFANAPSRIRIDTTRASEGLKSLRINPADDPTKETYLYIGIPSFRPDQAYQLTFKAIASPAAGEAPAPLRLDARILTWSGKKPLSFWRPERSPTRVADGPDLDEELRWVLASWSPSGEWAEYTLLIPPLPARMLEHSVDKAGIHLRVMGDPSRTVWLDGLALTPVATPPTPAPATAAAPTDSAPGIAIHFASPVQIFDGPTSARITPVNAPADATVQIAIRDARGQTLSTRNEPASGETTVDFAAVGYYDLQVSLMSGGDEELATDRGSLVVLDPLPADYYETPLPAFGVWGLDADLLSLGGAKWTRQIFWNQFEERGGQKPAEPPSAEKLAARSPIRVIRQLNVLDAFKPMAPLPREEWPETAAYLDRTVTRHRGLVDVWETQNELMVGENFSGTMQDAYDLLTLGAEAARRSDPGRPVAGICINPMVPHQYAQYLTYFRDFGAAELCDAVTVHPYTPMAQSPEASDLTGVLNRLAADLEEVAGREVPLYITEIGYSTRPSGEVTELEQAAYMVRTMFATADVPALKGTVWHIGYFAAGKLNREGCFSLMRWAPDKPREFRQPKPAYAAWATASRQLYDAEYLQPLEFGINRVGRLYKRRDGAMLVAYTLNGEPGTLRLHVRGESVTITDLCGAQRQVELTDGLLTLQLDGGPVYLEADRPDAFDDYRAQFSFDAPALLPGLESVATARYDGLRQLAAPRVEVETPAGWSADVSLTDAATVAIAMRSPASQKPGRYGLFLKVFDGDELRHAWQREVELAAPIIVADPAPVLLPASADLPGGATGMTARLTLPPGAAPAAGTMRIRDGRGETIALRRVTAPSEIQLPLLGVQLGHANALVADFTLDTGYQWRQPLPDLVAFAIPAGAPTIDGDLADWSGDWHPLPPASNEPDADAVASGQVSLRWSPDALYIAVDLQDHTPALGKPNGSMFGADSIQLGVSLPEPALQRTPNVGIMETDYAEIGLTDTGDGPASWVWATMNRAAMELHGGVPALDAAVVRWPDGRLIYEAAVPWASLGASAPTAGQALRVSVTVNDRAGRVRHYIEWYQGIATGKDSRAYGLAILAPPATPAE